MHYSVERYFGALRAEMPQDVSVREHVVDHFSRGFVPRLAVIVDTARQSGDVVHVTGDIHFATIGLRRRRSVLTVLDCGLATASGMRASLYKFFWLRWPARHAGRIVAISSFTADQVAQYARVDRARIDVIPVAVGDHYVPAPSVEHTTPVVLCFAQTPNKNVDRVIDALRGLDVRLNVIGPLTDTAAAALAAGGLSYDNEVGLSDADMQDRYRDCDVVLFPSTYEGFGMPIVEAQAIGRPVITSDRAPMNEVAGAGACLVDPDDEASIRAGVERVLADAAYRAELVQKGFANRERFRPAAAAAAYAQIYREMVGAKKRR